MALTKGHTNNPNGRPKGVQNKFTGNVKKMFLAVFESLQKDDKASLETWAKSNPTEFYKIIGKLMPREIDIQSNENKPIKILPIDLTIKNNDE